MFTRRLPGGREEGREEGGGIKDTPIAKGKATRFRVGFVKKQYTDKVYITENKHTVQTTENSCAQATLGQGLRNSWSTYNIQLGGYGHSDYSASFSSHLEERESIYSSAYLMMSDVCLLLDVLARGVGKKTV